jgi:uncharacterized membrane protein YjjP (DUF1212 family)
MTEEYLYLAIELGEKLLISGAEVSRVEESLTRICSAYGSVRTDVYATTSSIVVSVEKEDGGVITQTRRIASTTTDIEKLDYLNNLSRKVTASKPTAEEFREMLKHVNEIKQYSSWLVIFCYALIAGAFTLFFGARTPLEILFSFIIGGIIGVINMTGERLGLQKLLLKLVCSFTACTLAFLVAKIPIIPTVDNIIIGNVMSLIPGIGLTNALRDLFTGDVNTGILRSIDALLLGIVIAAGYILSAFLMRGV